jgi:hypothetical protein
MDEAARADMQLNPLLTDRAAAGLNRRATIITLQLSRTPTPARGLQPERRILKIVARNPFSGQSVTSRSS